MRGYSMQSKTLPPSWEELKANSNFDSKRQVSKKLNALESRITL